ncbi:MAG: hypothetical protein IPL22_04850 [Bacteroidetes bacterium]|nr:hypothetical protein [Bacteroidota bacterium]
MKRTFDNLPEDVATLIDRVASLEVLLGQFIENGGNGASVQEKLLYTRAEVQELLKVSKPTIFKIDAKELPYFLLAQTDDTELRM